MRLEFIKLSSLFLLLFSVNVFATDTALILHSNFSDAHTNVKAQLEDYLKRSVKVVTPSQQKLIYNVD